MLPDRITQGMPLNVTFSQQKKSIHSVSTGGGLHCHTELQSSSRRAGAGSSGREAGPAGTGPSAQSVWDGREGRGFLRSSLRELMQGDGVGKRLRNSSVYMAQMGGRQLEQSGSKGRVTLHTERWGAMPNAAELHGMGREGCWIHSQELACSLVSLHLPAALL